MLSAKKMQQRVYSNNTSLWFTCLPPMLRSSAPHMFRHLFTSLWTDSQKVAQQGSTEVSTGSNTSLLSGEVPWTECLSPKTTSRNPNLYVMFEVGPLGSDEVIRVKPSWMGLMPVSKDSHEFHPLFPPCEVTSRSWWSVTWKRPSPEPDHAGILILDFQPPKHKFTQVHGTLLTSLNSLRQGFWSTGLIHGNILGRMSQMVGQLECCKRAPGRPWEGTPSSRAAGEVLSSWSHLTEGSRAGSQGEQSPMACTWSWRHTWEQHPTPAAPPPGPGLVAASHEVYSCCPWRRGAWAAGGLCVPETARGGGEGLRAGSTQPQLHLNWTLSLRFWVTGLWTV